jgi:REP element-mobilizing transposase RayT
VYHVWTRATDRRVFCLDAEDRSRLVRLLALVVVRFDWRCHMFCILDTHYHLAIATPQANIDRGMHWLNGVYAQTFNKRHGRYGHLVAERYSSRVVDSEEYAVELCRYIPLNPVRAGLCATPQQWPWSSYAATLGRAILPPFVDPTWVLDQFAADVDLARSILHSWVMSGIGQTLELPEPPQRRLRVVEG